MIKAHADQRINELNQAGGFNHHNGIMILDWQDGLASLRVDFAHDHLNPLGLVHGGLYASMLDVALAMSGSYRPAPEGLYPGLTLSLTTQYIAPLQLEDSFAIAKARRTGGGKTVFFAKGEVLAPDGRVIASASGVFKPGRPVKG
ncbi:MAG: PaaI family thioesterase [Proteobacteria bacterium]|jgi:acyl-coenzyme A thioesterase 13|nr:PaaI family thioesterase [Pseudomonadota bacterium]MDA0884811.1 PaaI family thioesterase [Pseudomonadota bacterium]MDA1150262.1 PaaI family thioesterase [Pseudomonadota bacterium]